MNAAAIQKLIDDGLIPKEIAPAAMALSTVARGLLRAQIAAAALQGLLRRLTETSLLDG